MTVAAAVFFFSLAGTCYAYGGYTLLLWIVVSLVPRKARDKDGVASVLPPVTLIISAYNEETVIRRKLENTLSLDYPMKLLEIVVVSDGSSDRTDELVRNFKEDGVQLRHFSGRIGKSACLNLAVPDAQGSIIVFSDANSIYAEGALRALVRPFEQGDIGFVTGWTQYGSVTAAPDTGALGLYSKMEFVTKQLESRFGTCIGADGAIFAIRKELYSPLQAHDINDLVTPLSINQQGLRGVLEEEAVCFESNAGSSKGEFERQVRITSRTIRALISYRKLLNPLRFGFLSVQIASHKLCRLLVPLFLVGLLGSNVLLAGSSTFFKVTLAIQAIIVITAAIAGLQSSSSWLTKITGTARTFLIVNAAIALAWIRFLQGKTYTTWVPTKR